MNAEWFIAGYFAGVASVFLSLAVVLKAFGWKIKIEGDKP